MYLNCERWVEKEGVLESWRFFFKIVELLFQDIVALTNHSSGNVLHG